MRDLAYFVELLEGISDDLNGIRAKLGLECVARTEPQKKRYIREETERDLVRGEGIQNIKDYCINYYKTNSFDKFIQQLKKDFDEAKICPQCKTIYYEYTEVDGPHTWCLKCLTPSHEMHLELITTSEYKKGITKRG